MKKIFILVILPAVIIGGVSFFLMSKIAKNKNISKLTEISTCFDGTIDVSIDGKLYKCDLKHTPEQMNTLEILTPKELEGLTFIWEGEKCTAVWKNLQCELNKDFLPQTAFAETIVKILNLLSDKENLNLECDNSSEFLFSGKTDTGDFKVKFDKTGTINKISVPDMKLEAEFNPAK